MQKSLHSHHVDHVSWVGGSGHLLTRAWCFDSSAKRVFRLFRPSFFDTLNRADAVAPDHVGFHCEFPGEVELFARWTMGASSENIGDGLVCIDNEILLDDATGRISSRRMVYMPTVEPAVHAYAINTDKKQANLAAEHQEYHMRLGDEIVIEEDKRRNASLRAVAVQSAGRGWMVGAGELEKIVFWRKVDPLDQRAVRAAVQRRMNGEDIMLEDEVPGEVPQTARLPNGHVDSDDSLPNDTGIVKTVDLTGPQLLGSEDEPTDMPPDDGQVDAPALSDVQPAPSPITASIPLPAEESEMQMQSQLEEQEPALIGEQALVDAHQQQQTETLAQAKEGSPTQEEEVSGVSSADSSIELVHSTLAAVARQNSTHTQQSLLLAFAADAAAAVPAAERSSSVEYYVPLDHHEAADPTATESAS